MRMCQSGCGGPASSNDVLGTYAKMVSTNTAVMWEGLVVGGASSLAVNWQYNAACNFLALFFRL